ncbi:MAG: FxsA family protein [Planctomycetota bacterium]|nr:MAG: FxsA family protein [Planctomycetota bacterium]REJ93591.1 MAG: FxsA family protein [Planctomycetota bacterium]REK19950.1 MAG: FxsA family protein [Planctomycetota bacterium]REK27516.1 MAG: FxsA family protein [Planctomycetota bacterium]
MRTLLILIALLTLVPVLELVILLQFHHAIASQWGGGTGLLLTVGTIACTGILGAALARRQGLNVLNELRMRMNQGKFPGQELLDGVLILTGAVLLLTPGLLTDALGFSFLIPASRRGYRRLFSRWVRGTIQIRSGRVIDSSTAERPHDMIQRDG